MANLTVEIWKGTNEFAHKCKICGKGFKVRGNKRKHKDLCGRCAISFSMTNRCRKLRGQKPLNLNEYRCEKYAEKIYKIIAGIR